MHGAPFAERLERLGLRVRRFGPPAQLDLWERQSG
jgi:hypothetical protein